MAARHLPIRVLRGFITWATHTKCRLFRFGFGYLKLPEAKWCFFEIIEKYRPEKSIDAVLDLSRKSLDKPDQTSPNLRRDHRIS